MKKCSVCKKEKDESCFSKHKNAKDGLQSRCKDCHNFKNEKWRLEHKEEIAIKRRAYNQEHKEELKIYNAEYYQENKIDIELKKAEWNLAHKEEMAEYQKGYQREHKDDKAEYDRKYNENNKEVIVIKRAKYCATRLKTDPAFRFRMLFSTLFRQYLKSNGVEKNNSTYQIVGYTPEEGRTHIEALFSHPDNLHPKGPNGKVWMNWDNWGKYDPITWNDKDPSTWKWHLDHIDPQSEFNCTSEADPQVKKCWALINLRPYRAKDNIIDGATRIRHTKDK